MAKQVRLPPGCGELLKEPYYYSEHQQRFQRARRTRYCLTCRKNNVDKIDCLFLMDENSRATCPRCRTEANGRWGNLIAPRAFVRFMLLAGRGGGKTLNGAMAVREELMIPGAMWWALGATYKLLHDSTFPTLVGLLSPDWIHRWDPEHTEIILKNGAMIAFRSLEDPDRARGPHGIGGYWFDEAAKCPERAWHVATPMLIKAGGIAIATTTPLGFDWTYDQIEKKALVYKEPGYFAAKWHSEQNPLFASNPIMRAEIERARRSMTPEFFAQEYQAERTNATGLVYGRAVADNVLHNDDEVRYYIPEWPNIDPSRKVIIGLDEGADHPFGAVLIVVTPRGLVVVGEFLERMRAVSAAHDEVHIKLGLHRFHNKTYAGNKNALNLRLEWGLKGTGVVPAESKHEVGIQRVSSWLLMKQLKFVASHCPRTIEQMGSYRWSEKNMTTTGEKSDKEKVFKLHDELPDGIRYGVMAWPELPNMETPERSEAEQRRLDAFDAKTRRELEIMEELRKQKMGKGVDLQPHEDGYPVGNIYQHDIAGDWRDM